MMVIENSSSLVTSYTLINALAVVRQLCHMLRSCSPPPGDEEQDKNQDKNSGFAGKEIEWLVM